jgi:type III secretion protein L
MSDFGEDLRIEAERTADNMLRAARAEVAAAVTDAEHRGAADGLDKAQHMRDEIERLSARMLSEVTAEVVRAAVVVARELLVKEMQQREDAIVDVVAAALSTVKHARDVNVRIHPRDAAIVRQNQTRLVALLTRARGIEIREDRRVHAGGVLIETEAGVVDAQIETQLDEIQSRLTRLDLTPNSDDELDR